jgi:hypothetical protein
MKNRKNRKNEVASVEVASVEVAPVEVASVEVAQNEVAPVVMAWKSNGTSTRLALSESEVVGFCKSHGIAPKGFYRFLTGNDPKTDLAPQLAEKVGFEVDFNPQKVLRAWKNLGRGVNVARLVNFMAQHTSK